MGCGDRVSEDDSLIRKSFQIIKEFLFLFPHEDEPFQREFLPTDPDAGDLEVLLTFEESTLVSTHLLGDEELDLAHDSEFFHDVIDTIHSIDIASIGHTSDLFDTLSLHFIVTILTLRDTTSLWIGLTIFQIIDLYSITCSF